MCDVPNNAVLCIILAGASSEIATKCVLRMSYVDPSASITTGTIVTYSGSVIFGFKFSGTYIWLPYWPLHLPSYSIVGI